MLFVEELLPTYVALEFAYSCMCRNMPLLAPLGGEALAAVRAIIAIYSLVQSEVLSEAADTAETSVTLSTKWLLPF